MKLNTVQLVIAIDAVGFQIKRGRSNVSWQELTMRERKAIIKRLENIISVYGNRLEVEEPKKYCGKCRTLLPVSAFYKRSDNGRPRPFCKECEMENGRNYRAQKKLSKDEKD